MTTCNNIAIVGNGKLSKDYGKYIDKHDIIIRFNHAKIKGYEKQVGTKTNILALVGATDCAYEYEALNIDNDILKDIKHIMFSDVTTNAKYEKLLLEKKSMLNQSSMLFEYINYDCFKYFLKLIGMKFDKLPSTGMNILTYMLINKDYLNSDTRFNVYGFDSFKSGHYFDNDIRNNSEFHPVSAEMAIIEYLKKKPNISFFT